VRRSAASLGKFQPGPRVRREGLGRRTSDHPRATTRTDPAPREITEPELTLRLTAKHKPQAAANSAAGSPLGIPNAGAQVFQQFFGLNVVASIVLVSIVVSIYTVLGGLRAVVITETIQTVVFRNHQPSVDRPSASRCGQKRTNTVVDDFFSRIDAETLEFAITP